MRKPIKSDLVHCPTCNGILLVTPSEVTCPTCNEAASAICNRCGGYVASRQTGGCTCAVATKLAAQRIAPSAISADEGDRLLALIQREGKKCSDPTSGGVRPASDGTTPTAAVVHSKSLSGLAEKIAAARPSKPLAIKSRGVGEPVAGMVPNDEQEAILAAAAELVESDGPRILVVVAGAGCGKTAVDRMLEQVLPGNGQYTAFSKSLVEDSRPKFKKAKCSTQHSLAFQAVGKLYAHRLKSAKMRTSRVAYLLGIQPMQVEVPGITDAKGNPKPKNLSAEFLTGRVKLAVDKFCQSADREIGVQHLRYIEGIDHEVVETNEDGTVHRQRSHANNDLVHAYLLPFVRKMWDDLSRVDGQFKFEHGVYVKLWQLGTGDNKPYIPTDYILVDEAQDLTPVFLDIIQQQTHAMLVMVGDDCQMIFEWMGCKNAMKAFPGAPRRLLSMSYRFGQAIADVANTVLAELDEPTDLVLRGNPDLPSRVADVDEPRCFLYRTNAGAVGRVMQAIGEGKRPHLIGGGADVVAWCKAAMDLQVSPPRKTDHPELSCFDSWSEVKEYSESDEGDDMKLMVRLIETFGAEEIHDALENQPSEADADFVCSTAHKSKGREWDTVRLGSDFPTANRMQDADRRLLYVAATRAKLTLDVSECPPFCGGEDRVWGIDGPETEWIPGLTIEYTQPMPTEEEQAERLMTREAAKPESCAEPAVMSGERNTEAQVSYTKLRSGDWGLRATSLIKEGQLVTVMTKAGERKTETVGTVFWSGNGVWLAEKAGNGNTTK